MMKTHERAANLALAGIVYLILVNVQWCFLRMRSWLYGILDIDVKIIAFLQL